MDRMDTSALECQNDIHDCMKHNLVYLGNWASDGLFGTTDPRIEVDGGLHTDFKSVCNQLKVIHNITSFCQRRRCHYC